MHTGQHSFGGFPTTKEHSAVVSVSQIRKASVSVPAICHNDRLRFDCVLHESYQALPREIWYALHPDSPDGLSSDLGSDRYQRLVSNGSAPTVALDSADEGLIHLDFAGQPVPTWPDHRAPDLVEPRPSRTIATQAQNTLETQRTRTVLLTDDPPDRPKPDGQGTPGVLKDRAGGHRYLLTTAGTHPQTSGCLPASGSSATRTDLAIGPTKTGEVFTTRLLGAESRLEFAQAAGPPLSGTLPRVATGVKGIPKCGQKSGRKASLKRREGCWPRPAVWQVVFTDIQKPTCTAPPPCCPPALCFPICKGARACRWRTSTPRRYKGHPGSLSPFPRRYFVDKDSSAWALWLVVVVGGSTPKR